MDGCPTICEVISAEWVVKFHTQYEPDEKDFKDVYAVCAKFGIAVPGLTGKWNLRLGLSHS